MKSPHKTVFWISLLIIALISFGAWRIVAQNAQQGGGGNAPYSCMITLSTNTTTQCQPAPGTGFRNYVQSYQIVTTALGSATTIGLNYGTGTNCGTGTTALTAVYPNTTATPANSNGVLVNFSGSGLVVPFANAVCGVQAGTTAGTSFITINGYVGP
jgi:hypothetical protein